MFQICLYIYTTIRLKLMFRKKQSGTGGCKLLLSYQVCLVLTYLLDAIVLGFLKLRYLVCSSFAIMRPAQFTQPRTPQIKAFVPDIFGVGSANPLLPLLLK
ncbi:hypothetical protein CDL12_07269 [Handroanthus impetiginosus]|uniref:Uncharacterized protein n=1 Tax=Handroanthus impetiginosus TaxID=429701 RepID=A0A2G9HRA5_9LAMI|nr:hypothetical protein CDL12_07269 [Handroanthus impetiginosus]